MQSLSSIFANEKFVQALIKQDEVAFQQLYESTVDSFYRFLRSYYQIDENSIQDIISDTFIKIWNNLTNLNQHQNPSSYIWAVLRNTAKDYFKKTKEYAFSEFDMHSDSDDSHISFEDTLVEPSDITQLFQTKFQSEKIITALELLEDKYKEVVFLKYVEGLDNSEISSISWISEDNVRQRLSRWLAKLRDLLT